MSAANRTPHIDGTFVNRVITATTIVFGSALVLMALWYGRHVLLLLVAGLLLALLFRIPATWLSGKVGLDPRWTVTAVLLTLLGLLVTLGWLAGPAIGDQLGALQSELMNSVERVRQALQQSRPGQFVLNHLPKADSDGMDQMWVRLAGVSATVVGAVGALLLVVAVGVFFAYSPQQYVRGLLHLVPIPRRPRACAVLEQLHNDLRRWLLSQLIEMAVLGVLVWIALLIVGLPLALPLAIIAGLSNFIPYIGSFAGLLPVALIGIAQGPHTGMLAIGGYLAAQLIEGNLIMPLVYQRVIHIPPALTIAAQLTFAAFAGLLGVLLAAPLAVISLTLVRMMFIEDALGDRLDEAPECPQDDDEAPSADDAADARAHNEAQNSADG